MATANFKTMADFPLIVGADTYIRVCPECGISNEATAEKCTECGCDLTGENAILDEWYSRDLVEQMEKVAAELNDAQPFYKVTVESGYYSGIQFYVDSKYWRLEDMDNEESRDEFGICRSEMLRQYKVAGNTIRKGLYKAKDELGLDELVCTARFSNGEAWYSKVDTRKPLPVKVAAKIDAA
jgi:ribosomal protein L40E